MPGTTKPATPMTSFTFTDMARMPFTMAGVKPAPAALGASLFSVIGSFSATAATSPRSTTSATFSNLPAIGLLLGHPTSLTSSLVKLTPSSSGLAATTTCVAATGTSTGFCRMIAMYTPILARGCHCGFYGLWGIPLAAPGVIPMLWEIDPSTSGAGHGFVCGADD